MTWLGYIIIWIVTFVVTLVAFIRWFKLRKEELDKMRQASLEVFWSASICFLLLCIFSTLNCILFAILYGLKY